MIPQEVVHWLRENALGEVAETRPASGGCINNGVHLTTTKGERFFLKTNRGAPPDMFACEAEGLRALQVPDGPRVPKVYLVGEHFLLLEDLLPRANPPKAFWEALGRALAHLHTHTNPSFGFTHDNYIGSTPQPNPWTEDGYQFFAEHRLRYQTRLARRRGLLSVAHEQAVERLIQRLPELIPPQPASLIHGDLWRGNLLIDENGAPALIDPATHFGWAEAELGMMGLFGGFSPVCIAAYQEVRPCPPGLQERYPIYNLYHLLNHLNLFGGGYLQQVEVILKRFA
ncbi:MAG: hypothetical protein D6755_00770 [Anaerolineae bacterium]|nr:MAG: hypothetical protein D6755_00770 [Anaerolineae bacterium]